MEDTQGLSMVHLLSPWGQCLRCWPSLHSCVSTLGNWLHRRGIPKGLVAGQRPLVGRDYGHELCWGHVVQAASTRCYYLGRSHGDGLVWSSEGVMPVTGGAVRE